MARRKKAQLYDIIQKIIYLYENEKKDFKTIESLLRTEGYDISKSAIHRAYKDYSQTAKEYEEWRKKVEILVEQTQNKPTSLMLASLVALLTQKVVEFTKDIDRFEFEEPEQLIGAVHKLSQMSQSLEKHISEKLQEATKKIEEEGKKRNIDPEFLKLVKEEIYGV
jgi:uncharacterized protein with HEPN domain